MDFVSIRTATLRGDQKIDFDIYVLIGGKYITYIRKGDSFEGVRLDRLKAKKLKKMYIRGEEESSYRTYLSRNFDMAYDSKSGKSLETRSEVIQGAQQSSAEAVMEAPEDQKVYAAAKENAQRYVEFLMKEEKAVKTMLNIENTDQDLAHHGVTVSTLAVALAQQLGVEKNSNRINLLALGALLHDFGHVCQKNTALKPLSALTAEEKTIYLQHPAVGGDQVRVHQHFDSLVSAIIAQHEELIDGSGYPNKLIEKKTDPLAVIVSTVNDYDRFLIHQKLPRQEALKKFMIEQVGLHPLDQIKLLKNII